MRYCITYNLQAMRFLFFCLIWSLVTPHIMCAQHQDDSLKYMAQNPPNLTPEVFLPGVISKSSESEFGSVFNKDGTAFYYGVDSNGLTHIRFSELIGDTWTAPKTILSNPNYGFNDPFLSPDEQRLYFISNRSKDGLTAIQEHDIWYVEKQGEGWSSPINAGPNINSNKSEYYMSFTQDGTMYFSSNKEQDNFNIYYSKQVNGEFQEAVVLGDAVNTSNYEADVFVDPKEQYIIFCARRPEGLGRGDLYISFKNTNGSWTKAVNMGDKINSKSHELCPFVTADGKFLFYTSNQDIYWVSTAIIDQLKN